MLKLYDYYRSSASFRVRICLHLKNIPHEVNEIHLVNQGGEQYLADYTKLNPQQRVPSLIVDDQVLTQSLAIIDYLEQTYPEPSIYPISLIHKTHCQSLAQIIACDTHTLNNLRTLKYLQQELRVNDQDKSKWYQHWVMLGLTAFQEKLQQISTSGDFCFGNQVTLADLCLIPQLYNARRFHCDISSLQLLTQIEQNCKQLDAFNQAWPEEVTV